MTYHRPSLALSEKSRKAAKFGDYAPRVRAANEAGPREANLWLRPNYVPARDNRREDGMAL